MDRIRIEDLECYEYAKKKGYEPLSDIRFEMDINLRLDIQRRLFGTGHSPAENERFYRFCWDVYPHYCQECMKPLREYSSTYISHIKTRGSHPELAHDCRNVNILCFECHSKWENGNKKQMRIYPKNQRIIRELYKEYNIRHDRV